MKLFTKLVTVTAICLGIVSLLVAAIGVFARINLLHIRPYDYTTLSSTMFLFAVAVMCFDRFYCSADKVK